MGNVTLYNAKSENNYAVVWIRDSDLISVHGFGGNFCPFPNSSSYNDFDARGQSYAQGYTHFMPSSFRIQRSTRVTLANIVNVERVTGGTTSFISAGLGYDPRTYNMILNQDGEGECDPNQSPQLCSASPVLDRPVLWRLTRGRRMSHCLFELFRFVAMQLQTVDDFLSWESSASSAEVRTPGVSSFNFS